MRIIRSTLAALMLLAVLALPALAGGDGGDKVTKTFSLDLTGERSPDQLVFGAVVTREQLAAGQGGKLIVFCADIPDDIEDEVLQDPEFVVVSGDACEERNYTAELEFERGSEIAFLIVRFSATDDGDFEIIASTPLDEQGNPSEFERLDEDVVNGVSASLDGGSGAKGRQEMPPMLEGAMGDMMEMMGEDVPAAPRTGFGGAAGAGVPLGGPATAALPLLLAGGYALRRRR
jgi:hypothetical protein